MIDQGDTMTDFENTEQQVQPSTSVSVPEHTSAPGVNISALQADRVKIIADLGRLQNEAEDIRGQLERAAMRKNVHGKAADPDWFNRAQSARRIKLSQIRHLQARVSEINNLLRAANVEFEQVRRPPEELRAGLRRKQLNAALAVCRVALRYYDAVEDGDPLILAIDDLDDVMPGWDASQDLTQDRNGGK